MLEEDRKNKMKKVKIKVTAIEWTSKKVEYICEVDKEEYDSCKDYGVGYLNGSDILTDAEGFDATTLSSRVIDEDWEGKTKDVEWEEV